MSSSSADNLQGRDDTEHIFEVLQKYYHPFVLVGLPASRWMGCASCADDGFDMVIRTDQIQAISTDLVNTGHWEVFDAQLERETFEAKIYDPRDEIERRFLGLCSEANIVLMNMNLKDLGLRSSHLRLWSEETYLFSIDMALLVEVPRLFAKHICLAEEDFHPSANRQDSWFYGPALLSRSDRSAPEFAPYQSQSKGVTERLRVFYVPRIPAYLDVLVAQYARYNRNNKRQLSSAANFQIRNLTRYLFLELPH